MEAESATWVNVLISWAPFLLLIGFWIFFMKKFGGFGKGNYIQRQMQYMERHEQLLERIAVALERLGGAVPTGDAQRRP